jgi:hypothetical protein
MSEQQKKANLAHATQVLSNAIMDAMKKIAEDTGALAIIMDAHLQFDARAGIGGGAAGIGLVYPPEEQRQPADPQAAEKLVADLLRRLKSSRGN